MGDDTLASSQRVSRQLSAPMSSRYAGADDKAGSFSNLRMRHDQAMTANIPLKIFERPVEDRDTVQDEILASRVYQLPESSHVPRHEIYPDDETDDRREQITTTTTTITEEERLALLRKQRRS